MTFLDNMPSKTWVCPKLNLLKVILNWDQHSLIEKMIFFFLGAI